MVQSSQRLTQGHTASHIKPHPPDCNQKIFPLCHICFSLQDYSLSLVQPSTHFYICVPPKVTTIFNPAKTCSNRVVFSYSSQNKKGGYGYPILEYLSLVIF